MGDETVNNTNEKVDKVASSVKGVESRAKEGFNSLRNELSKTTKGIKALEKQLNSLRKDFKKNHSNLEDKLKDVSVKDSARLSYSTDDENCSVHETTVTT